MNKSQGIVIQYSAFSRRGWVYDFDTQGHHYFEIPHSSTYHPKKGTEVCYTKKPIQDIQTGLPDWFIAKDLTPSK